MIYFLMLDSRIQFLVLNSKDIKAENIYAKHQKDIPVERKNRPKELE